LEVTLLAAFHGGQETLTKFYIGEFKADSKVQNSRSLQQNKNGAEPGVNFKKAKKKRCALNDYWQMSGQPTAAAAGINLGRYDFELMGKAITKYEKTVEGTMLSWRVFRKSLATTTMPSKDFEILHRRRCES